MCLDGGEYYGTVCPKCGQEIMLEEDEFWEIVKINGCYGTNIICTKCSAIRQAERAKNGIIEFPTK